MSKSAISPAALNNKLDTINSKIDTTDITSSTSLLTLAENTPSGTTRKYWTQSASNITDYPSSMTSIGATAYVQITIERKIGIAAIHITAVKANGQSASIFGEKINTDFYWEAIPAALNDKATPTKITLTARDGVTINVQDCYRVGKLLYVAITFQITTNRDAYSHLFQLPSGMYFASSAVIPLFTEYFSLISSNPSCIYADKGASTLRNPGYTLSTGSYRILATLLLQ